MQEVSFEEGFEKIHAKDPRYPRDAYLFVRDALDHTVKMIANREERGRRRHVSGQELLEGIREHALAQFGPMSKTVFAEWNIHACKDFGDMVFNMIEIELLAKTENDSREDFADGYNFDDAFSRPFLPSSKLPAHRGTSVPAPDIKL
jgi:uncharacterized repeat protein (TIGR04138 family)